MNKKARLCLGTCTFAYDVNPLEFQVVAALALGCLLSSRAAQGAGTSTLTGWEAGAQRGHRDDQMTSALTFHLPAFGAL